MSDPSNVAKSLRERLGGNTEDRLGKALSDLLENPILTNALAHAFDARERASQAQEVAMGALNIPSAADIERLTRRLALGLAPARGHRGRRRPSRSRARSARRRGAPVGDRGAAALVDAQVELALAAAGGRRRNLRKPRRLARDARRAERSAQNAAAKTTRAKPAPKAGRSRAAPQGLSAAIAARAHQLARPPAAPRRRCDAGCRRRRRCRRPRAGSRRAPRGAPHGEQRAASISTASAPGRLPAARPRRRGQR